MDHNCSCLFVACPHWPPDTWHIGTAAGQAIFRVTNLQLDWQIRNSICSVQYELSGINVMGQKRSISDMSLS